MNKSELELMGFVPTGNYTATIERIELLDPSKKEGILFPSFQWVFKLIGGKHDGRFARGLTPRVLKRSKKPASNEGRLLEFLDILHGTPITPQVIKKYSSTEVPINTLRSKYAVKDGKPQVVVKIRITVKYRESVPTDYRCTSIRSVI